MNCQDVGLKGPPISTLTNSSCEFGRRGNEPGNGAHPRQDSYLERPGSLRTRDRRDSPAYAKSARVELPPLEEYEREAQKIVPLPKAA